MLTVTALVLVSGFGARENEGRNRRTRNKNRVVGGGVF